MWRYLLRYAGAAWRGLTSIWRKHPISPTAVVGAGGAIQKAASPASRKVLGSLWNVMDKGFTAYAVYSAFSELRASVSGGVEEPELALQGFTAFIDQITPSEAMMVLTTEINDTAAMALALERQGTVLLSDPGETDPIRGMVYFALADYVSKEQTPVYEPDELSAALTLAFADPLISSGVPAAELQGAKEAIAPDYLRELPREMYIRLDFLAYTMGWIATHVEDDEDLTQNAKKGGPEL